MAKLGKVVWLTRDYDVNINIFRDEHSRFQLNNYMAALVALFSVRLNRLLAKSYYRETIFLSLLERPLSGKC